MRMQRLVERRQKKIDPNQLPPKYLPKKASMLIIGLVIAIVILACLLLPFLIMKMGVAADNQCNQVQDDIDACNAKLASMEDDYESFLTLIYPWSVVMDDVQQTPIGAGGALGDISQSGNTISINGEFVKEKYVYEYAVMLNETGHFSQVNINSITEVAGEGGNVYRFNIQATLKSGGEE